MKGYAIYEQGEDWGGAYGPRIRETYETLEEAEAELERFRSHLKGLERLFVRYWIKEISE
jgi:hypothetical protein